MPNVPRLVVAGTSSGVGKTTIVVGLARALRRRGLEVALFKCGPDYLDPTYHARAAGRPTQNLDGWMMGRDAVRATFARSAHGADVALIEGMMGLFDGASATSDEGSTAEIAKWLDAPVLLVVDASAIARSIAPLATGFAHFDAEVRVEMVACNRVGGRAHLDLLRAALAAPEIVGGLPADAEIAFPERHLGLLRADEASVPEVRLEALGAHVAEWFDLDRVLAAARRVGDVASSEDPPARAREPACRIGIAYDEALHFYYEDNLRRLEALGAELVRFSPLHDDALPEVDGLYLGGGYPEAHADALERNRSMRDAIRAFAASGAPIYAECGGLMLLTEAIRTLDGRRHAMVGAVPGEAVMHERLQAIGYVEVETVVDSPLGPAGLAFRGHQFRHSELVGVPRETKLAYRVRDRFAGREFREGFHTGGVLASYVHAHWASNPRLAEGLVAACTLRAARR